MQKLYCLTFLISFFFLNPIFSQNTLTGKITMPQPNKAKIGSNYDEADDYIDPMNIPNNNVIISLHPVGFDIPTKPSEGRLTQKGKSFVPKVLPITINSKVHFLNEDEFYHNVYSTTPKARFNLGRRATSVKATEVIEKVGVIKLGCNIHDNMKGYILSFNTPYFVRVSEDGTYSIKNIKNGSYRVEIFHPNAKKITSEVNFDESGNVQKDFNFTLQP